MLGTFLRQNMRYVFLLFWLLVLSLPCTMMLSCCDVTRPYVRSLPALYSSIICDCAHTGRGSDSISDSVLEHVPACSFNMVCCCRSSKKPHEQGSWRRSNVWSQKWISAHRASRLCILTWMLLASRTTKQEKTRPQSDLQESSALQQFGSFLGHALPRQMR